MRQVPLPVLAALIALGVMVGGCAWLGASPGRQPAIDIAILTVLEPEYDAVAARVENLSAVEGTEAQRYRSRALRAESRGVRPR